MENNGLNLRLFDGVLENATSFAPIFDDLPDPPPPVEGTPTDPPSPAIDEVAPNSTVEILPSSVSEDFTVTWYGLDNEGGSGVDTYDVFVSTDGGEFELWQDNTTAISATYDGESDRTYGFYSVASDANGNSEAPANEIQAVTTTNGSNQQPTIYRFFNPSAGVHFYTSNVRERDNVFSTLDNYIYEGASYFGGSPEGSLPVYRFLNTNTGVHLYTVDEREREFIQANQPEFEFEGEVFRAYSEQVEGTTPVYRFFNPSTGTHFYTPTEAERAAVEADLPAYELEGIAYYTFPLDADVTRVTAPVNTIPPVGTPSGVDFAGSTVILQEYGPNLDTPVTDVLTATVGDGVEFDDLPASDLNLEDGLVPVDVSVDVSANSVLLEVEQEGSGTFAEGEFTGYLLVRDPNTTIGIENVIIDESATTLPLDSSDIIFLEEGIAVNVAGIEYNQGDTLKLDVNFGDGISDVPPLEPTDGVGFNGAQLQYQSFSPDFDTPIGEPIDFTVADGQEFDSAFSDTLSILVDVTNSSVIIEVDSPGTGTFTSGEFNGEVFSDLTDTLPPIQNVTIDTSATTLAIDTSDIAFFEDGLTIDFADIPYADGDVVKLDVEFPGVNTTLPPETLPEPNGNFTGAEVGYQTFFPDLSSPAGESLTAIVGAGAEFVVPHNEAAGAIGETVDIAGDSIFYEVTAPAGTFADGGFNGLVLTDLSDTIPDITGIAIDRSGSTFEVDPSQLTFDANSISLNLAGVSHEMNDTLKLDVQFADI